MLSRLGVVALLTTLLLNCGGDPNIESAKLNLSRKDYVKALESIDTAIETNPANPLAWYYRGYVLSEQGKSRPAAERAEYYTQADAAFTEAEKLYEAAPSAGKEYALIDVMRTNIWVEEYNAAIGQLQGDEAKTDEQYALSLVHLDNAFAIQPDSISTLDIAGEVHLMRNDYEAALTSFQQAANSGAPEPFRYVRLGQLFVQMQRYDEAITALTEGRTKFPGDLEITQGMADAYLQKGDTENAIAVLRELITVEPENAQYRLVYAIQIYDITTGLADEIRALNGSIEETNRMIREEERKTRPDRSLLTNYRATRDGYMADVARLESRSDDLTAQAEVELKKAVELNPTDARPYYVLGIINQNRASAAFDKRNATEDNAKANEFDAMGKKFLEDSLPNYEKAAELDPENTEYWLSLFRVYTALGMTDKALEAQQKAGL